MNLLGICFSIFDPGGIRDPRGLWWYKDVLGSLHRGWGSLHRGWGTASATRRSATHLDGRQLDGSVNRSALDGKRSAIDRPWRVFLAGSSHLLRRTTFGSAVIHENWKPTGQNAVKTREI